VGYGDGRYGSGLLVKDTTKVSWGVSIPAVFHVSFWFIPTEITTIGNLERPRVLE
jgi:hypothetical protein